MMTDIEKRLLKILTANGDQLAAIDRILEGKPEAGAEPPKGPLLMMIKDAAELLGVLRITPAPSPFWTEVAGDRAMELKQEVRSHGLGGEVPGGDVVFDAQDTLGQQRSQLAVAQEPAGCLDIAGSAAWR